MVDTAQAKKMKTRKRSETSLNTHRLNDKDLGICEDCKIHTASLRYSDEPIFAISHGFSMRHICQCCYVKRIRRTYKKVGANLIKQEKALKKHKCAVVSK